MRGKREMKMFVTLRGWLWIIYSVRTLHSAQHAICDGETCSFHSSGAAGGAGTDVRLVDACEAFVARDGKKEVKSKPRPPQLTDRCADKVSLGPFTPGLSLNEHP